MSELILTKSRQFKTCPTVNPWNILHNLHCILCLNSLFSMKNKTRQLENASRRDVSRQRWVFRWEFGCLLSLFWRDALPSRGHVQDGLSWWRHGSGRPTVEVLFIVHSGNVVLPMLTTVYKCRYSGVPITTTGCQYGQRFAKGVLRVDNAC